MPIAAILVTNAFARSFSKLMVILGIGNSEVFSGRSDIGRMMHADAGQGFERLQGWKHSSPNYHRNRVSLSAQARRLDQYTCRKHTGKLRMHVLYLEEEKIVQSEI